MAFCDKCGHWCSPFDHQCPEQETSSRTSMTFQLILLIFGFAAVVDGIPSLLAPEPAKSILQWAAASALGVFFITLAVFLGYRRLRPPRPEVVQR